MSQEIQVQITCRRYLCDDQVSVVERDRVNLNKDIEGTKLRDWDVLSQFKGIKASGFLDGPSGCCLWGILIGHDGCDLVW